MPKIVKKKNLDNLLKTKKLSVMINLESHHFSSNIQIYMNIYMIVLNLDQLMQKGEKKLLKFG